MPSLSSPKSSLARPAAALLLLLLSTALCACAQPQTKPVLYNRPPPPAEWTSPLACPEPADVPEAGFKNEVDRWIWVRLELFKGDTCRLNWQNLVKYVQSAPKLEGDK